MTRPAPADQLTAHEVTRPAQWDALVEQYRMAVPPDDTGRVDILEVGLDGRVVVQRDLVAAVDGERVMDRRAHELINLDRSLVLLIEELQAQTVAELFDTDGTDYLFAHTMVSAPQTRYRWRPGMAAPVVVDQLPDWDAWSNDAAIDVAMARLQAQQDGYSIWLSKTTEGHELVIDASAQQRLGPIEPVRALLMQGNTAWLLHEDATLTGYDITTGNPAPTPELRLPDLQTMVSDGRTVLYIWAGGIGHWLDDKPGINFIAYSVDRTSADWRVSGDWASWCEYTDAAASCYLMDLRTGAYTRIPTGDFKGSWGGVRNGYLVVAEDLLRPAVIPLDALGGLS